MCKQQKIKNRKKNPVSIVLRFLRGICFIILGLLLFALIPFLWPIYLGIYVFFPKAVINLLCDTKVF